VCSTLMFFLLLSAQSRAETEWVDIAQLAHSTVGITRYFDEAERGAFQSPTNIVTVGHVATAMGLSTEDWKPLDIKDSAESKLISVDSALGGQRYEKIGCARIANGVSRRPERCHSDGTT
ncbi:MAG: hypothetical protein WA683_08650, partial [Pseudolabrys sp.]